MERGRLGLFTVDKILVDNLPDIFSDSANLSATLTSGGSIAIYYFEYGEYTSFGMKTESKEISLSASPVL